MAEAHPRGKLTRISGPLIIAAGMPGAAIGEIIRVGEAGLPAEIIRVDGDSVHAQVFEETQGIAVGEPVEAMGAPLSVELGPGLLGKAFDGIQRPLGELEAASGPFIERGQTALAIDHATLWRFVPAIEPGQPIRGGDILGTVQESATIEHRILVPPAAAGTVRSVVGPGEYSVDEPLAELDDGTALTMMQRWPVKRPRPAGRKLPSDRPFLTGQRVLDCLFPISLGGTAIVPGGFGTGKTVVEQTLSKSCNADIIIYVGCGERGNEMADVLSEFPELIDPRTGTSLMGRTILIVNTSNMPVAARDASVYTGITIAEYYRDQGYDVALMADSTSRWAEALREISSRLEEMPGEEGYPTYLTARISEFYERAGRVVCAGTAGNGSPERYGSLTVVGAVSPPGGDFSEPVVQSSLRVAGGFWALDPALAYRRHYPAVNWNRSYSLYWKELEPWFTTNAPEEWCALRQSAMTLLQQDAELQEVVQLVGPDALQDAERLVLESARMLREVFLQQNAFSEEDAFCPLEKTHHLLEGLLSFHKMCKTHIEQGIPLERLLELPVRERLARLRDIGSREFAGHYESTCTEMKEAFEALAAAKGKRGNR